MKIALFFLPAFVVFISCTNNKSVDHDLLGTWKLKEILVDPGDGKGEFVGVQSDKTITFFKDSTVTSNGDLCQLSSEADQPSKGVYSPHDQTITSEGCSSTVSSNISFTLSGDELILSYQCIEPCRHKFQKVN